MKNTLKISGIASAILTLMGSVLKTLHLPGAGVSIVLGGAIFCLVFLPLLIALKFRDEESRVDKWVFSLGFLLAMTACLGILFKVQHWPYANILMLGSIMGILFVYVPVYFLSRIRRPEAKFNTIVNSVLMTACGGLIFALFNLGYSTKLVDSLLSTADFVSHNKEVLVKANEKLLADVPLSDSMQRLHTNSSDLLQKIEHIKTNLIQQSEGISAEKASGFPIKNLKYPNDTDMLNHHFVQAKGELSLSQLEKDIAQYNAYIKIVFPNANEKIISLDELQFRNSVTGFVLYNLTQVQLQIANNENSYLSYLSCSK